MDEKIVYKPENIVLNEETKEFTINDDGIVELENSIISVFGSKFTPDLTIKYLCELIPVLNGISSGDNVDIKGLSDILSATEVMFETLRRQLNVPENYNKQGKGEFYFYLFQSLKDLEKEAEENFAKQTEDAKIVPTDTAEDNEE